jgi:molybdopterin-guanine dinucleotide biosynthesis protein MobB
VTADALGPETRVAAVSAAGSGTGKTRWVEALCAALVGRGERVAVVKHHGHGARGASALGEAGVEHPAKDTVRARRAGAIVSVLATRGRLELALPAESDADLLRAALAAATAVAGANAVVLVEGFRAVPTDVRVWVGAGQPPVGDATVVRVRGADADRPDRVAAVLAALDRAWRRQDGGGRG